MKISMFATLLVASALAAGAQAQDQSNQREKNKDARVAGAKMESRIAKASDLIGADVENTQGEDLGDISDLAIKSMGTDAKVGYVVVSFGGALGLGDKLFAIPWSAFGVRENSTKVTLNVPKESLKNAPGFDKNNWPDMADPTWEKKVSETFGIKETLDRDVDRLHEQAKDATLEAKDAARQAAGNAPQNKTHGMLRASKLIGMDVRNSSNENLGDVEDLAISINDGRVAYTVLSFGGFLGIGDKFFAIPWGCIDIRPGQDKAILDIPKDKLKSAPGFDKKNWPDMGDEKWCASITDFYGTGSRPSGSGVLRSDERPVATAVPADRNAPSGMLRTTKVIGTKVKNTKGESLGDIDELVIDPRTGKVAYAVISFGGFLGIGDKTFPVPFEALNLKPGEKTIVIDVDKERLKQAPNYDVDKLPDPSNRAELERIYGFYGIRPSWDERHDNPK